VIKNEKTNYPLSLILILIVTMMTFFSLRRKPTPANYSSSTHIEEGGEQQNDSMVPIPVSGRQEEKVAILAGRCTKKDDEQDKEQDQDCEEEEWGRHRRHPQQEYKDLRHNQEGHDHNNNDHQQQLQPRKCRQHQQQQEEEHPLKCQKKDDLLLVVGQGEHITIEGISIGSCYYHVSGSGMGSTITSVISTIYFPPLSPPHLLTSSYSSSQCNSTISSPDTINAVSSSSYFSFRSIAVLSTSRTTTTRLSSPRQPFIFNLIEDSNWGAIRLYLALVVNKKSPSSPRSSSPLASFSTQQKQRPRRQGTGTRCRAEGRGGEVLQLLCQEKDETNLTCLAFAMAHGAPLDIIKTMIQIDPSLLYIRDDYGATVLHVGCLNGAPLESLNYVLHKYEEQVKHLDIDQRNPLHHAVEYACSFYTDDHDKDKDHRYHGENKRNASCSLGQQTREESIEVLRQMCKVAPQLTNAQDNTRLTPIDLVQMSKADESIDHNSEYYSALDSIYQVLKKASVDSYKEAKRTWEEKAATKDNITGLILADEQER
jgi:hypothetical protein